MLYKSIIRRVLFRFNPEDVHQFIFTILSFASKIPILLKIVKPFFQVNNPLLHREIAGLTFKNPVGIAAGLDKDAEAFDMFDSLGFSHIEIGTVTPKAQPGNPQPRLFRLIQDNGIINRMGFNNEGIENAIRNLRTRYSGIIIGGNIGKNKLTEEENAVFDYEECFEALFPYVDYFTVNISSPNTPNLRAMQNKEPLHKLLSALTDRNKSKQIQKPIFLKIAPDLSNEQVDEIIEVILELEIDGIVATNTTISRENISISENEIKNIGAGGLSGKPLRDKSTQMIKYIAEKTEGKLPIIGVGGIMTPEDVLEKLKAGASLVQVYTGFIYEGPSLARNINRFLLEEARNGRL